MKLKPMPRYILVRCNIKEQKDRKERHGIFYTHPDHQFMIYNMEWGEILAIGERASTSFPEAKVGQTLIFHHFVQGESKNESKKDHLIHEDETYYYYVVTTEKFNGKRNETYGVWDGEKIIPHPEFVFLEVEKPKETYATPDDYINSALSQSKGGLLLFREWKTTKDDLTAKMQALKEKNQGLSVSGLDKPDVREQIQKNEEEMQRLSDLMNKPKYFPYTVMYANKLLSQWFDRPILKGQLLYMSEVGALKVINFKGTEYRIGTSEHIGYITV